jgi:TM2 domain-containing membrane protein YozV
MKKLWIYWCLLSSAFLSVSGVFAQLSFLNANQGLADSAFANGQYELALSEYNRLVFESKDQEQLGVAYYKIAKCHEFLGSNPKLISDFFDRSYFTSNNDSLKVEALLGKSKITISQGQYKLAIMDLLSNPYIENPAFESRIRFYSGLCYFLSGDVANSRKEWQKTNIPQERVDHFFKRPVQWRYPNPLLASYLSIIIPGLGQFYAGEWNAGLNSLLVNGLFLTAFSVIAVNVGILDAALSGMPWFQRYYLGGVQRAYELASEKQEKRRLQAVNRLLQTN